ncbi:MAG: hypothetical protein JXC85_05320, partial [Candidatus Aenigmarchaeota archaeon]|nr:hypothetical protein [Candidatus Aenigmarchaeota archaeon]
MNKRIPALAAIAACAFILLSITFIPNTESFPGRRNRVIGELSLAIEDAVVSGNYKCCIDPPCDMCYLGHWIWDDGSCHCDEMMERGEFDKVCPQCVKG